MHSTNETAGVIAPPPLLALAAIVLGLLLDWLLPAYVLTVFLSGTIRMILGTAFVGGGLALVIAANVNFRTAGTRPEPWKPSFALVTDGIFAWLRNPMYVGGTLCLAGLAVLLTSDWMLIMTIGFFIVLHFGVVRREERYLEAKFGENYRHYCHRVPRYGWPG
jgi:protein-S-isoprenylcysteine O-methyltransferase Ste14